jgi:hypothetical protein
VELDSDKRPHELDCQSQSGLKISAPSGLFGTPLFQRIEDNFELIFDGIAHDLYWLRCCGGDELNRLMRYRHAALPP